MVMIALVVDVASDFRYTCVHEMSILQAKGCMHASGRGGGAHGIAVNMQGLHTRFHWHLDPLDMYTMVKSTKG